MILTRALRLGALLTMTMALAASFGPSTAAIAQTTKPEPKTKPVEKETAKGKIDLNSATFEELQTLPGIGEATARKIIDSRPHKTLSDLNAFRIPSATLDKLKPMVEIIPLPTPVEVNIDPIERLETLPGVGPVLAKEIVASRPHANYESIAKVKGIGPEKLDALRGRLKFAEPASAAAKPKPKMEEKAKPKEKEAVPPKAASTATATGAKVNINTANRDTLDALPGIGPVKAQAIIEARAEKPFTSIDDIMKVKGIKEGEFGKIKDMITVK